MLLLLEKQRLLHRGDYYRTGGTLGDVQAAPPQEHAAIALQSAEDVPILGARGVEVRDNGAPQFRWHLVEEAQDVGWHLQPLCKGQDLLLDAHAVQRAYIR